MRYGNRYTLEDGSVCVEKILEPPHPPPIDLPRGRIGEAVDRDITDLIHGLCCHPSSHSCNCDHDTVVARILAEVRLLRGVLDGLVDTLRGEFGGEGIEVARALDPSRKLGEP